MYTICDVFDTMELDKIAYTGDFPCGNLFKA